MTYTEVERILISNEYYERNGIYFKGGNRAKIRYNEDLKSWLIEFTRID